MEKRVKELAEQAGFCFWGDEPWGPGEGNIDWSCNYSQEFEKFVELMKQEQLDKIQPNAIDQMVKSLESWPTVVKDETETELVMVDTIMTYRVRYAVEVPKGKTEWALDTVTMEAAKEFSQEYLGEQIVGHRVVSEVEAISMLDKENEYSSSWPIELKKKNFFTSLEEQKL